MAKIESPYDRALRSLFDALTPSGFLASTMDCDNYRRVWTRDGVIAGLGLAALETDSRELINGVRATLNTIAKYQGPHGEIPSNVDPETGDISYGKLAGRVDSPLWYIIGICSYTAKTGDMKFFADHVSVIEKAVNLLSCWEFNNRGFIYAPVSGDWADEYILHGYTLLAQVLYYFAIRGYGKLTKNRGILEKAAALKEMIEINFRVSPENVDHPSLYHPYAYEKLVEQSAMVPYFLPAFSPAGYKLQFDGLSNALILLSDIGNSAVKNRIIEYGKSLGKKLCTSLIPAFYPPIMPGDNEWRELITNYRFRFRNQPYSYHNGGLWPMITGFWSAGLSGCGMDDEAESYLRAIHDANRRGINKEEWGFYECHHGIECRPLGTRAVTWSASAAVMAHQAISSKKYPFAFLFN